MFLFTSSAPYLYLLLFQHSNPEESGRREVIDVGVGAGDMWISAVEGSILTWEEVRFQFLIP